ncbi:MAG: hypothetical protein AAB523_01170 [Patescibacteria group bacterium]
MHSKQPNDKQVEIVNRQNPGIANASIVLTVNQLKVAKASQGKHCIGIEMQNNIPVIADTTTGKGLAFPKQDMRMFIDAVKKGEFDFVS